MREKYTKTILEEAVKKSVNYSELMRNLGYQSWSGFQWSHIKSRVKKYKIDTSHFTHKSRKPFLRSKKSAEEILIKTERSKGRADGRQLKRACLESGLKYKCQICNLKPIWNKKKLTLEIDHINGDWSDNKLKNLRFLCPNCHSQTTTCSKNKTKRENNCKNCGKQIGLKAKKCRKCASIDLKKIKRKTKIDWPSDQDMLKMKKYYSNVEIGKKLGISETSVRKRIKNIRRGPDGKALP